MSIRRRLMKDLFKILFMYTCTTSLLSASIYAESVYTNDTTDGKSNDTSFVSTTKTQPHLTAISTEATTTCITTNTTTTVTTTVLTTTSISTTTVGTTTDVEYEETYQETECSYYEDDSAETVYEEDDSYEVDTDYSYGVLTPSGGAIWGPFGLEKYYNADMSGVIENMVALGYNYSYWVRDDGVKMYGDYVMCAADLSIYPKGTIIETTLGTGMVCDTGTFVYTHACDVDIAVTW